MRQLAEAILGPVSKSVRIGWASWTILGLAAFCAVLPKSKVPTTTSHEQVETSEQVEAKIMKQVQYSFSANKQQLFKFMHPVGTAKSVVVHDVNVHWKQGKPTHSEKNVEDFTVRFTIYWEGPIIKDGFTKATQTFDEEIGRWTGGTILTTNGVTNNDAFNLGGYIAGEIIGGMLNSQ